jgi:myo-inositol-1(or 4)-monophosphatase
MAEALLGKASLGTAAVSESMKLRVDAAGARDRLIGAASEAGEIALGFFRLGERTSARVDYKTGGSPVTEADLAVDAFLHARLGEVFASAGWLSEETEDDPERLNQTSVLIVDPIDGTRGFLAGDPRWAVSVALIVAGRPVAGVVHAPALGETYAAARGCGSSLNGGAIEASHRETLADSRIAGPKSMIDSIARAAGVSFLAQPKIPSLAYRMALVASGALDLAVGSEKAHDWDIAAVDLIVEEAGGRLVEAEGAPLRYNNAETRRGLLFAASTRLVGPLVAAGRLAAGSKLA